MMKKSIVALAVAAAMMVTPAAAFADETEGAADQIISLSYEDINEDVYEGVWVSLPEEIGIDMYLPADWNVLDVSTVEGAEDAGIAFMAQAPEANADGIFWTVAAAKVPDVTVDSVEQIQEELSKDASMTNVMLADVNGIGAVSFSIEEKNVEGVAFAGLDGSLYTVQFSPMNDDDFSAYEGNMIMSISETEMGETEALTEAE